ncbi:hypothetical protein AB4Z42_02375 [Mycobacterium sp. 2YAF39]|uniref:hypothetical protein n=1 Tax=Mycobacterium sp. 2YAF39 TaxID=3233033 RepID=UPI003F9B7334
MKRHPQHRLSPRRRRAEQRRTLHRAAEQINRVNTGLGTVEFNRGTRLILRAALPLVFHGSVVGIPAA